MCALRRHQEEVTASPVPPEDNTTYYILAEEDNDEPCGIYRVRTAVLPLYGHWSSVLNTREKNISESTWQTASRTNLLFLPHLVEHPFSYRPTLLPAPLVSVAVVSSTSSSSPGVHDASAAPLVLLPLPDVPLPVAPGVGPVPVHPPLPILVVSPVAVSVGAGRRPSTCAGHPAVRPARPGGDERPRAKVAKTILKIFSSPFF